MLIIVSALSLIVTSALSLIFLRKAPVLLLDEATSALDSESERLIQKAIQSLSLNRTTLIVAHRLATVKEADRIVVMDNASIVSTGTHNDLLGTCALHARLAQLQFSDKYSIPKETADHRRFQALGEM